jgi:hypothetical protein
MRLSGLAVAVLFVFSSSFSFAQHSSSSSSSSGGGSHSSSSSSSSGGHSSSGSSASHSSSDHGSAAHGSKSASASAASPARGLHSTESKGVSSIREANGTLHEPAAQPEKRGFFSFLRHPFHKPEPKPVADLRRPVCLRGPCQICPGVGARSGGCGVGSFVREHRNHDCLGNAIWTGSPCVQKTDYLDDCSALSSMLQRQQQRMQAAESIRQSACKAGGSTECSEASATWQSEQSLQQSLQQKYQRCQQQSGHASIGRSPLVGNGSGSLWFSRF